MRTNCFQRLIVAGMLAFASISSFFMMSLSRASGQDVTTPALIAQLQKPIHLMVGTSALEQITAQLSQQTGLTIEAAPYLRQHQISVHCDGATAQSLLETLAELNDWQWQERNGKIVIERKLERKPRSITEIPSAVQRALAKDLRRYLMDGTENTITPEDNGKKRPTDNTIADQQVSSNLQETAVSKFCDARMAAGSAYVIAKLIETLKVECPENKRLSWKQMTDSQHRLLVAYTTLSLLPGMNSLESYQTLHGRIEPYYSSLQGMQIEFPGKDTIAFMQATVEGNIESAVGIAAQLHPEWLPVDLEQH